MKPGFAGGRNVTRARGRINTPMFLYERQGWLKNIFNQNPGDKSSPRAPLPPRARFYCIFLRFGMTDVHMSTMQWKLHCKFSSCQSICAKLIPAFSRFLFFSFFFLIRINGTNGPIEWDKISAGYINSRLVFGRMQDFAPIEIRKFLPRSIHSSLRIRRKYNFHQAETFQRGFPISYRYNYSSLCPFHRGGNRLDFSFPLYLNRVLVLYPP